MGRRRATIVLVVASLALPVVVLGAARQSHSRARLAVADGVPADLRELAETTWARFADAFPARRDCLRPVIVDGAWRLEDRATYDPRKQLVTVRIPATAHHLQSSLVHEFAHHLEFTCRSQRSLRPAFKQAQGFPQDSSWFGGPSWERTPSEHFAEATTEFVLARRPGHARIDPTSEGLRIIGSWAAGHRLTHR